MERCILITARKQEEFPPFGLQTFFFEELMALNHHRHYKLKIYFADPLEQELSNLLQGFELINSKWIKVDFLLPEFIYDRFSTPNIELYEKAECFRNFCLSQGCRFANPRPLVQLLRNKFSFHKFLERQNMVDIPSMESRHIDEQLVIHWLDKYGGVYFKPCEASNGRGIIVAKKINEGIIFIENGQQIFTIKEGFHEKLQFFNRSNYIIQPQIKYIQQVNVPFDLRVIVQNEGLSVYKVTGSGIRVGKTGSFVSNLNAGGYGVGIEDLETLLNINLVDNNLLYLAIERKCLKIAHELHLHYGSFCEVAFDILLDENYKPHVLEVNANPGRWLFTKIADRYDKTNKVLSEKYRKMREICVEMPLRFAVNEMK